MRERDPPVGTFHCPSVTSIHSLFLMNLKQYKGWSSVVFCSRERYSIILHFWKSFLTTCSSCGPTDHQAPELCLICTSASDRHTCHIIQHFQNRGKAFILHIFSFLRRTALYITNRQESLPPLHTAQQFFSPLLERHNSMPSKLHILSRRGCAYHSGDTVSACRWWKTRLVDCLNNHCRAEKLSIRRAKYARHSHRRNAFFWQLS